MVARQPRMQPLPPAAAPNLTRETTAPMLDKTLSELETAIRDLLQRNQRLTARTQELEQALQAAREENDTLQLGLMEQEEAGASTRQRVESLLALLSAGVPAAPSAEQAVAADAAQRHAASVE